MPLNSTLIPIAELAQVLISSWYSGNRGSMSRNIPTAIASTMTIAAPKYASPLISFASNRFIGSNQYHVELVFQIQRLGLKPDGLADLFLGLRQPVGFFVEQ